MQNSEKNINPPLTPTATPIQKPKWEKALPEKYTILAIGESNSLKVKVELETTDTLERKSVNSLMDSRATGEFINCDYAKSCLFNLLKLTHPILVYNIDRSPNEAGSITKAVSLILQYKNHSEWMTFCVTSLGKQKLILGHSWLWKHNLEINWTKGEVKMSRCPSQCCSECRDELQQERITWKAEVRRIDICSVGPVPEVNHDSEDDSRIDATNLENEPISIEEGDHAVELIPGSKPSGCKNYPLLPAKQKELDAFLKENLETGWI